MVHSGNEKPRLAESGASPAFGIGTFPPSVEPQPATTDADLGQSHLTGPETEPRQLSEEARQKRAEGEKQFALGLMRVISVLSRSSHYRHYTISDLEWLVVPPLQLGQCAILHAETPGLPVAAAVALWASVSPEVDLKLSQNLTVPIRLRPDEWRSGEILWLIDVVGQPDSSRQLLKRLGEDVFRGEHLKLRGRDNKGQTVVTKSDAKDMEIQHRLSNV